jgi:hypothetical protein
MLGSLKTCGASRILAEKLFVLAVFAAHALTFTYRLSVEEQNVSFKPLICSFLYPILVGKNRLK